MTIAAGSVVNIATGGSPADTLKIGNSPNDLTGGGARSSIIVSGAGLVDLLRPSDYIGDWTIRGSRLQISADNQLGNAANPLTLDTGGRLQVSGNVSTARTIRLDGAAATAINVMSNGIAFTVEGRLDGPSTPLMKLGPGTLSVARLDVGSLQLDAGRILLRPSGLSEGARKVSSLAMSTDATLAFELSGPVASDQYAQLDVTAQAMLAGTLGIQLSGGFSPPAGSEFVLATYASRTGQFSALNLPSLTPGLVWSLEYESTRLTLSVSSSRLLGDIDEDGDVDRADAALFAPYYGHETASTWQTGDFNGDLTTSLADLALLQANLGQRVQSTSTAAVPEPSALVILVTALASTLGARSFRAPPRQRAVQFEISLQLSSVAEYCRQLIQRPRQVRQLHVRVSVQPSNPTKHRPP
jgi:hypothetical protein